MGQKSSTLEESHNMTLCPQDSPELNIKSKKFNNSIDKTIEPITIKNVKDDFADTRNLIKTKQQPESGDPIHESGGDEEKKIEAPPRSKLIDECVKDDGGDSNNNGKFVSEERYFTRTCLNPDFLPLLDNPSIAELSQLTALKMMQNFEEFAKLDKFWKSQVNELEDKVMDDNVSEKDICMINYEELPAVQLCDNDRSLKQDSSTVTNEIKDDEPIGYCEGVNEDRETDEKLCEKTPTSDDVVLPTRKEEKKEEKEDEMHQLRIRVSRLECERDEALLKMRLAEERREAESRCLEATLGTMEDKLRNIVSELSEEVKKSRSLERQLTQSLQESSFSCGHMDTLASVD